MNAQSLIAALRQRGISLRLEGERLVAVPGSLLTDHDADQIRSCKPDLVAYLTDHRLPAMRQPFRSHCVTCGTGLDASSAVRCPTCVDAAYRARDQRRSEVGRAPPDRSDLSVIEYETEQKGTGP